MREAFGLARISSFSELTGESSEEFPTDDPEIDLEAPLDDVSIMEFVELRDVDGNLLPVGSDEADAEAVVGIRRTSLAARLKVIYGDVDSIDAFVGMVSEPALIGSELGELQYAMWKTQFETLRDGDANFYLWNRNLERNYRRFADLGVTYQQTLADIIANNTELQMSDIQANMFLMIDQ